MVKFLVSVLEGGAWLAVALNTNGWVSSMAWGFVAMTLLGLGVMLGQKAEAA